MIYDLHKKTKKQSAYDHHSSAVTVSMAQAQTAIPIPKHTYAYMTGVAEGLFPTITTTKIDK